MVIDKGLGVHATEDLCQTCAPYIDYIKFGFGTAALQNEAALKLKIEIMKSSQVHSFVGGTMIEMSVAEGTLPQMLARLKSIGFSAVEISDGIIKMSEQIRADAIARAQDAGFVVLSEVGKKDPQKQLGHDRFLECIEADLAAGVSQVVIESRESGKNIGIFDHDGAIKTAELEKILAQVSAPGKLIWEAPVKDQQSSLILRIGADVSLGNIAPQDVLGLEALRRGLRFDTFPIYETKMKK